ncbi:hypothetical protein SBA6_410059 [Candidatus Sulfopaludibacter sp. SbA6]|nr:hypothetical protein SBA6_410059 [Candidatus Sulfopaludibacter sp. SbA6]
MSPKGTPTLKRKGLSEFGDTSMCRGGTDPGLSGDERISLPDFNLADKHGADRVPGQLFIMAPEPGRRKRPESSGL